MMSDYIYSISAARRLFGQKVVKVEERPGNVLITFNDGSQNLADKKLFKQHFAEHRRQLGLKIDDVKPVNSYTYRVKSKYLVAVFPDRVSCTCGDYAAQQEMGIQRGCCKHGYAVLKTLGCTSLAEFIQKQKTAPEATNQEAVTADINSNDYSIVYKLVFETFGLDEDGVPLDVVERFSTHQPTPKEINCFRKHAHERGYKLVSVEPQKQYHHDEF
ncbi:MAG: hypothetical protein GVY04_23795 [Cyanobacteria bacterium]|jgi:hypothetical protein|nr:hypothetical protein [Cyanobacteria bacterium GSL.Bin1]